MTNWVVQFIYHLRLALPESTTQINDSVSSVQLMRIATGCIIFLVGYNSNEHLSGTIYNKNKTSGHLFFFYWYLSRRKSVACLIKFSSKCRLFATKIMLACRCLHLWCKCSPEDWNALLLVTALCCLFLAFCQILFVCLHYRKLSSKLP